LSDPGEMLLRPASPRQGAWVFGPELRHGMRCSRSRQDHRLGALAASQLLRTRAWLRRYGQACHPIRALPAPGSWSSAAPPSSLTFDLVVRLPVPISDRKNRVFLRQSDKTRPLCARRPACLAGSRRLRPGYRFASRDRLRFELLQEVSVLPQNPGCWLVGAPRLS